METAGQTYSRRDFLRTVGVVGASVLLRPTLRYIENATEGQRKELALESMRAFLIKHEDIPPSVVKAPEKNERFRFADDVLKGAIDIYGSWARRDGKPDAFYNKPANFLEAGNSRLVGEVVQEGSTSFGNLAAGLIEGKSLPGSVMNNLKDFKDGVITHVEAGDTKPITFSDNNIDSIGKLIELNPGSPILNRVKKRAGENATEQDLITALHVETDYIWSWIDKERKGGQMEPDLILAGLMYINDGDVGGSLWDATVLTKIGARNSPTDFKFNPVKDDPETVDLSTIRRQNTQFLSRFSDTFAPRISANWALENVDDNELFAHRYQKYDPKNFKPFDAYAAAGNFYHQFNIMALCGVMDYRAIQLSLLIKDTFTDGKIKMKGDYGIEKIAADWMTTYRAGEIQEILFALPERKIVPGKTPQIQVA